MLLPFQIGRAALASQLAAFGLISEPYLPSDCSVVTVLSDFYDRMGDYLALQYGGSLPFKSSSIANRIIIVHFYDNHFYRTVVNNLPCFVFMV